MQSEQGWSIPLEKTKDGKLVYYRYSDKNFSIRNSPLNEEEALQLKESISILDRFKGISQFEWLEEMKIKLETAYNIRPNDKPHVSFEQNPYLKGLEFFSALFHYIQNKNVIKINYQGFKQSKPTDLIIHPYYLKQYNNRWFLFGLNQERNEISNLALDRIHSIKEKKQNYIEHQLDFEEYFDDVIGVTISEKANIETIHLHISKSRWAYVESKPIHGSQKTISKDDAGTTIQLKLKINNELVNTILGFGEDIKVIEPLDLKETIKTKIKLIYEKYF
jgi:predicted DNA-binding transcriptional regulator YafY